MARINPSSFLSKNGKTIFIRSAETTDAEAILRAGKAVMAEQIFTLTLPEELSFTTEEEANWISGMNDHPAHLILVATFNEAIIGLLDFSCGHRQRIAHTGDFGMSVIKPLREEGIGTRLLQALLDWATAHPKLEKVSLKVHSTNDRAQGLYRKLGFHQEGTLSRDLKYGENNYVDTVIMSRFVK